MTTGSHCPACGAEMDLEATGGPYPTDGAAGSHRPDRIVDCPECGLGVAAPLPDPEELAAYYAQGEYWKMREPSVLKPNMHPGHFALATARWRFVRQYLPAGSEGGLDLLDVGAGHGFFLIAAGRDPGVHTRRVFATESDEVFRVSMGHTWERYGDGGKLTALSELSEVDGSFHVLCLSNILEHFSDPGPLLDEAIAKLGDGGVVLVDVPRRDERFKSDVYPHLLFFDERSLTALLNRHGLEVVDIGAFGKDPADSPVASVNSDSAASKRIKLLYPLRRAASADLAAAVFARHYGAERRGDDGTWVRAVARRSQGR